jgi:hypothetical protein
MARKSLTGWIHFRTAGVLEKRLTAEVARQRKTAGVPKAAAKPNRSTVGRELLQEALAAREVARQAG